MSPPELHDLAITVVAVLIGWIALGLLVGMVVGECMDYRDED